jgi:hypothetical protein
MSNMQWSVALLGAAVLVAVLAYNWWSTRRAQPRHATPLNSSSRKAGIEPSLEGSEFTPQSTEGSADFVDDIEHSEHGFTLPSLHLAADSVLDALIDAVVPIALSTEVSGDAVLAAMPNTRRVGSKSLVVEGQGDDGEWERVQPGHRYKALQAGLQLANRSGAINNIEFSEFVAKIQSMADALGGAPDFPDMLSEVARAKELDQFASQHDAQLGVCLKARGAAWSLGFIQHHASAQGLIAGSVPGKMVLPSSQPDMPALVTLRYDTQAALDDDQDAALRDLRLVLDVPHVARDEQAFEQMCTIAARLAETLDAQVVDDVGQPLPEATLVQIGVELRELYDALDQRDLSAGSELARRLFS